MSRAGRPDTDADIELRACITATPPRSFTMLAGAGSGKTTSLIKALSSIIDTRGTQLRRHRQQIACITYTEVAAAEIWTDVGNNPLVRVSTIHSFLWSLVRSFQSDIQQWVTQRIADKLVELRETAANFGPRVQQKTRDANARDIARYEEQARRIGGVRSFTYGTGSNYPKGMLGHDDIIKMVPQLLLERPLLRLLLAQQFPFVFVDESQDTFDVVVQALKAVDHQMGEQFCLGFFGDPMQRIYQTGTGAITTEEGWASITKPENFRCPSTVLNVANAIRRDDDALVQTRGQMIDRDGQLESVRGSATIFVLPADDQRDQHLAKVRTWTAEAQRDPEWSPDADAKAVKVLVVVHRMAAKREGFGDLYAALNDKAPDAFKNGFLDASAWPVQPFIKFVLPLVDAVLNGREFEAIQLLRAKSPLLAKDGLRGADVAARLAALRRLAEQLSAMMQEGSGQSNAAVLAVLNDSGILQLDPRLQGYLNAQPVEQAAEAEESEDEDEEDEEDLAKEVAAMESFLACPADQFWGYWRYLNEASPFSTQQGIKGAEFERVLVVLDDDEGTHVQFSYDKYLGLTPLSDRDRKNLADGKETAVERTRRLFYVCCTRALKDLVVVWFTADPAAARERIRALEYFEPDAVHAADALANVQLT